MGTRLAAFRGCRACGNGGHRACDARRSRPGRRLLSRQDGHLPYRDWRRQRRRLGGPHDRPQSRPIHSRSACRGGEEHGRRRGLQLFNYLYGAAPQDGTEIGSIVQFPFEYLFETGNTKAHFDAVKFRWIGGPVNAATIAVAWTASSAVRNPTTCWTKELIVRLDRRSRHEPTPLRNVVGFYKVTLGYPGGAELDLAMVRGETQGRASMTWSALQQRNPEWISDKKIAVLYQMGVAKSTQIPADVPLILDFAKTPEDRAVLELKFATNSMGYPIFAPPGIPQDRLAALRKALADALDDPVTRADAAKLRIDIEPMTGAAIETVVNKAHASPPAVIARLIEGSKPPN